MATDIEVKALVLNSARQAAHVLWVGLEHSDGYAAFSKQISSGQSSRSGTDDGDCWGETHLGGLISSGSECGRQTDVPVDLRTSALCTVQLLIQRAALLRIGIAAPTANFP